MTTFSGWGGRIRGLFAISKGPWGSNDQGGDPPEAPADGGKGSGPWGEPGRKPRRTIISPAAGGSVFEEILRRGRSRFGGEDGSGGPNRSLIVWGVIGFLCLWLVFTSFHSISPGQRGVVSRFGRYSYTLGPGIGLTLPSPIDRVKKIDVENIRNIDLGAEGSGDLMLTGDQNLLDIDYSVRWNIRTPELYLYELAQPDETIREVAESAMRSVISRVSLNDAMGDRRADIETQVTDIMQRILDSYRSGVQVQGIAIKQADPPDEVNDAFKQVTAAQQDAQTYINNANAYALQLGQKAQG
ncbi:MAG: FtsH protease activity modulator HflK, partial [Sphingomicrobium sp.]